MKKGKYSSFTLFLFPDRLSPLFPLTMKRLLLLFCGGTIIMKRDKKGALMVKEKEEAVSSLFRLEPRIRELANIDHEFIDNIDSSNITPKHWDMITKVITEKYDEYDGFILTHGTDTMAYTASALTFTLGDLGKPVILTGAQIPGDSIETDARRNLINSVRVALLDISGVYIVFDDKIILGARSSKVSESKLGAFATKNAPDAGEIRTDIRILKDIVPKRRKSRLDAKPGFENDILVITLVPGRNVSNICHILENEGTKGLVIRAFSTGNFPDDFLPVLEEAYRKKIPVVVTSQCLRGSTMMEQYEVGSRALKLGTVQLYDMSIECAVTKFMWALRHFSYKDIRTVMQKSFVGELNPDGAVYG